MDTEARPRSSGSPSKPGISRPERSRASTRPLIRSASSPAAFRVNVTPRTSSGRTSPLATSQTTRSAMVAVLPEPAPASTRRGVSGAVTTSACSCVGGGSRSRAAMSPGEWTASSTRGRSIGAAGSPVSGAIR